MNITTINNPSGLISVVGRPDMKELAAASAQTRFEPEDQIGQIFGQQLERRSIRRESVSNRDWKGCAGMRHSCEWVWCGQTGCGPESALLPALLDRNASMRVAPHCCSLAHREEGAGGRMRRGVYVQMSAASATKGAAQTAVQKGFALMLIAV